MNKVEKQTAKNAFTRPASSPEKHTKFKMNLKANKAFCGKLCMHTSE
jgi:hypothetical protein